MVLPAVTALLTPDAEMVVLAKPQFEVGRSDVGKGGVVRDEGLRLAAAEKSPRRWPMWGSARPRRWRVLCPAWKETSNT
ncbi:MAG: hypothetical protein R2724_16410 [Bryobacterales bacterium]